MNRTRLLPVAMALLLAALLMVGAAWHFAARKSLPQALNRKPPLAATTMSVPPAVPAAVVSTNSAPASPTSPAPAAPCAPAFNLGDIQFMPREKIATVSVTDHSDGNDIVTSYEFYRVGRFADGAYKGADLLMAFVSDDGPCKGPTCGGSNIVRYLRKGSVLFPLPRISDSSAPHSSAGPQAPVDARPFAALGATYGQTLDCSVPLLEYPATLVAGPRAVLHYVEEGVGSLNPTVLKVAFHEPVYGDVWTTKPELAPQRAFYDDRCLGADHAATGALDACAGLPNHDFTDNAFYVFRPDGTYLTFSSNPDFQMENPDAVTWHDGRPAASTYRYQTLIGCSWDTADAASVVSPSVVNDADLQAIAKVNSTGDLLYGLKDRNHPLYKKFYADYAKSYPNWNSESQDGQASPTPESYDNFLKARPLFLWRDPFGRLIRFTNTQYVMPNACEPILYLYPAQTGNIEVKLGDDVAVLNSYPAYRDGWLVSAQPGGELTDLRSGRKVPYLFWEGHSYILPMETKGFVVKSSDVPAFLHAMLPKLGLDAKEAGDFISAWSSRLAGAPYYFLAFVDKSVIDRFYPLRIDPPPDTTIRVLMDFAPLSKPIPVQPPALAPPPRRQGFTVVEWGVLVR